MTLLISTEELDKPLITYDCKQNSQTNDGLSASGNMKTVDGRDIDSKTKLKEPQQDLELND
jgi:hypothetical protein